MTTATLLSSTCLGSTTAVADASGAVQDSYTYDVYGTPPKTGSLANEFDFAGQQTDGTGLQYLRARYYDPATGTFATRDLLVDVPQWLGNGQAYAQANPARWADPTGLVHCGDAECGGGGGGGAGGRAGPNPVEGKYPKAWEPILKGRAGVRSIKGVLESEGYTVVGQEVRISTEHGTRVVDLIAEYNGKYYAIEVKNGPR